jgi:hypothetical protein
MIEWLKLIYGTVGVNHPYVSTAVAALLGALLLSGAWYSIGVAYRQEHPLAAPAGVAPNPAPREASSASIAAPKVAIEGPPAAHLGRTTYFTILSQNAVRATWSIGGFQDNKVFSVEPLGPSHQIYVEPTDPTRVGAPFTLSVTVYAADGKSASTTKRFLVIR